MLPRPLPSRHPHHLELSLAHGWYLSRGSRENADDMRDKVSWSGYDDLMQIERECSVCGKQWSVEIPERGALPIYCSPGCSAKAARARAAARRAEHDAAIVDAIDAAIAALRERHVAQAINLLEGVRTTLLGGREGAHHEGATDH